MHVLAHAGGHTLKQASAETLLLFACLGFGWGAYRVWEVHLFGRPRIASWAMGLLASAALGLAFVVPSMLGIKIASVRPSTNARIVILSPRPHQVLDGTPATVRVRLRVQRARVVTQTSTHLTANTGHIHLYVDGMLVTMAYATAATIEASPGSHRLKAEFVAVDHGPFRPPVTASVSFRVVP